MINDARAGGLRSILSDAISDRDGQPLGSPEYMDAVETIARLGRRHPELRGRPRIGVMDPGASRRRSPSSWDEHDS